ncbi:unnamed protein product [Alopecurus aequalis]
MALHVLLSFLVVRAVLALTFFSGSEAGEVGVCYGMKGDNLMQPPAVVQLLKRNGINSVSLYDADAAALDALANTGIRVSVSLPNEHLAEAAACMCYARHWVESNVKAYPNTLIDSVAVGNEVFHQQPQLTPQLLPAMKNIQAALASCGLADAVKVTTPIALTALKEPSFPPSLGEFHDNISQSVMSPMVDFVEQTGSYLSFNVFPYFAYKNNPQAVDLLDFVLFRTTKHDQGTNLTYHSMFDAMADAVFHALDKLDSSSQHTPGRMLSGRRKPATRLSETGYSSSRSPPPPKKKGGRRRLLGSYPTSDPPASAPSVQQAAYGPSVQQAAAYGPSVEQAAAYGPSVEQAASVSNAQTYTSALIRRVLTGGGTPYNPDADISVNIFSLFNENQKPGDEDERNFGLFYPDGTPVYIVDFGGHNASWCTANAAVGEKRLQAALDLACSHGVNCSAIQRGKPCYKPNTLVAHASYVFDAYYQSQGWCDFDGAASIVYERPTGTCGSWCVANAAADDASLHEAMDYACSNGARCKAIRRGGRCFRPDSIVAHASYALNDYYQRRGRAAQSCHFDGSGSVVHKQPKFGNCVL